MNAPPATEAELLERAEALAGYTLQELSLRFERALPAEPRRAKGYIGELIERALGAAAGSRPTPDFPRLHIELKTIPLDARGLPRESTFVCSLNYAEIAAREWENSRVRAKLVRVLWVPIESAAGLSFGQRRVGVARLWSPSRSEEAALCNDWEEVVMRLDRGEHDSLSAHVGRYLQVRPKAAHAQMRTTAADAEGAPLSTLPRGFYLRTRFTRRLFGAGDGLGDAGAP